MIFSIKLIGILVLFCDVSIAGRKPPPPYRGAIKRLGVRNSFSVESLREARKRLLRPRVLEEKKAKHAVFEYSFAQPANPVTQEKILEIVDKSYNPPSLVDIRNEFPNSSYEEVSFFVKQLVEKGEVVVISVALSAVENFNMFTTFAKYEFQTFLIVDYIRTRSNVTEAELLDRFPFFFDYWVMNSIVTDLIEKKLIKPSETRAGAWTWNSFNSIK